MQKLINTFLELAAFDEVYPNEDKVLKYIKKRLDAAKVSYRQDKTGNIVARIEGKDKEVLGLCGHVDIAAPLDGRQIVIEGDIIKTDGRGVLGADDRTAVAMMLELADYLRQTNQKPKQTIELLFTIGEEAGLVGANKLDMSLLSAKQVIVLDWLGKPSNIAVKSAGRYVIDVEYIGKESHAGFWQKGKNAGAALMRAASQLTQGEYCPGVNFNIGIVQIGEARNQVPGRASLQAESRSFDGQKMDQAVRKIVEHFQKEAAESSITAHVKAEKIYENYDADQSGPLFKQIEAGLKAQGLTPRLDETFAGFDANILASRGIDVISIGPGYYNPHASDEYLIIPEFVQTFELIKYLATNQTKETQQ